MAALHLPFWLLPATKGLLHAGRKPHTSGSEQPCLEPAERPQEKFIAPQPDHGSAWGLVLSPPRSVQTDALIAVISLYRLQTPILSSQALLLLYVGLLFFTTDCSPWVFCPSFGVGEWARSWVALHTPTAMGVLRPLMGC